MFIAIHYNIWGLKFVKIIKDLFFNYGISLFTILELNMYKKTRRLRFKQKKN